MTTSQPVKVEKPVRNKLTAVKRAPGGVARILIAVKMSPSALDQVDQLADGETFGNRSEMLRRLLAEALTRRVSRASRGPCPTCRG